MTCGAQSGTLHSNARDWQGDLEVPMHLGQVFRNAGVWRVAELTNLTILLEETEDEMYGRTSCHTSCCKMMIRAWGTTRLVESLT